MRRRIRAPPTLADLEREREAHVPAQFLSDGRSPFGHARLENRRGTKVNALWPNGRKNIARFRQFFPSTERHSYRGRSQVVSVAMPTSKEYRYRAEECLRLANDTKEIFARMALLELVTEFRAMAQQLELRERRNTKQRFSAAAVRIRP